MKGTIFVAATAFGLMVGGFAFADQGKGHGQGNGNGQGNAACMKRAVEKMQDAHQRCQAMEDHDKRQACMEQAQDQFQKDRQNCVD
jgi:hypothetical protein